MRASMLRTFAPSSLATLTLALVLAVPVAAAV